MNKEKKNDILSKYHEKNNLANILYLKQDEFDLSNPFEVANCVINLGYRKINENDIVISKEEYRKLKLKRKNAMAMETARKVCEHIENDNKKIRKETAEKIFKEVLDLEELKVIRDMGWETTHNSIINEILELAKQFGVEIE